MTPVGACGACKVLDSTRFIIEIRSDGALENCGNRADRTVHDHASAAIVEPPADHDPVARRGRQPVVGIVVVGLDDGDALGDGRGAADAVDRVAVRVIPGDRLGRGDLVADVRVGLAVAVVTTRFIIEIRSDGASENCGDRADRT